MPKKQPTTYQIITHEDANKQIDKEIILSSSNIIEESFVNATSSDIFTFEEDLVSDDMKQSTLADQGKRIEVVSNTQLVSSHSTNRQSDEFDLFGKYVAEVLRNMRKPKARDLKNVIWQSMMEARKDEPEE